MLFVTIFLFMTILMIRLAMMRVGGLAILLLPVMGGWPCCSFVCIWLRGSAVVPSGLPPVFIVTRSGRFMHPPVRYEAPDIVPVVSATAASCPAALFDDIILPSDDAFHGVPGFLWMCYSDF